jgi:hypothetical protein
MHILMEVFGVLEYKITLNIFKKQFISYQLDDNFRLAYKLSYLVGKKLNYFR